MNRREMRHGSESQDGFTILELTVVFVVTALVLLPLLKLALESVGSTGEQLTQSALESATDGLIAYAATNNGCLPFAADFEGGLVDTDQSGALLTDTGIDQANKHSGDLPWSTLGLTESFRDGDYLRLQYYVATPYTGADCPAGFRGFEFHSNIDYVGASGVGNAVYVYYGAGTDRKLYEITDVYPVGRVPPKAVLDGFDVADVTALLPATLLEVRRGPDIDNAGAESHVLSAQNVFVLIAVGKNRNLAMNRRYMRDSTHAGDSAGGNWTLGTSDVDDVVFSNTTNIDATDRINDGDDTLKVMSFLEYKARLREYGLNMEPMCETAC